MTMNPITALTIPKQTSIPEVTSIRHRLRGQRLRYTPDQKAEALAQVATGKTIAAVASDLGIVPNTISTWLAATRRPAVPATRRPAVPATPDPVRPADLDDIKAELSYVTARLTAKLVRLDLEREALCSALAGLNAATSL